MAQYLSQRIEDPLWLGPKDISHLRGRVSDTEIQIKGLEDKMHELRRVYEAQNQELQRAHEAQISSLLRQKDAKLVEIASLRNVLSPIRRLPPEILCEIFELARQVAWDIVRSTYILCQVCVAWQKIAYAHPRLWSALYLSLDEHPHMFKGEAVWVKRWISRSQSTPLDFHFDFTDSYPAVRTTITRIVGYMVDCCHQIRLLDLCAPLSTFLPIFTLPCSSLPILEAVHVSLAQIARHQNKMEVLLGASKLRMLSIIEVRLDEGSILQKLAIPVEQLTSLTIDAHDYDIQKQDSYAGILHRCKNLVSLETRYVGFSTQLSISLPALKSLHVSCHRVIGGTVNILCCLTTPLLEHLIISQTDQSFNDISTDVANLKHRSMFELSSLTLHCLRFEPLRKRMFLALNRESGLTNILSLFPTTRSLRIFDHKFDFSFLLRALTYGGDSFLLPKLTELELDPRCCEDGFPSALTAMILSRWWPDDAIGEEGRNGLVRLQRVKMDGSRFKDSNEIAQISQLPGLVVDFEGRTTLLSYSSIIWT